MNQNQTLLKQIIKQIILIEAPVDVWKNKNQNLSSEQTTEAETYFSDLTGKYNALLDPTTKDLTKLNFNQLEILHKSVEIAKNKNLKAPFIQWLTKKFKQLNLNLQQIIEDYIPPLLSLQKNKEKFQPNFLKTLQSIEQLNQELNQKISSDELAVSEEQYGKLAEKDGWILYMPHTTEASCELGKTGGRRDTTWCTTRPDSSNLFLQYSAQPSNSIILFYVIKQGVNAETDPLAKMSVGFVDGKPMFNQGSGGVSVNANNDNLTKEKFEQTLGKDLADKFLQIMQKRATDLGGEHPAKQEFRKLVQNPKAFAAKLDSFSKDENGQELRMNFIESALQYENVSPEILTLLAKDANANVRINAARSINTPIEILTTLAQDISQLVRGEIAQNPSTPTKILTLLAQDTNLEVRLIVAENRNTPTETLTFLAQDTDRFVRIGVAQNPNTPIEALTFLTQDTEPTVRRDVAQNPNTPMETLTLLAQDTNAYVRASVAGNRNTPTQILTLLAQDTDTYVRIDVAGNPNTPMKTLTILAKDTNEYVKDTAKRNLNTKEIELTEAVILEKILKKLLLII